MSITSDTPLLRLRSSSSSYRASHVDTKKNSSIIERELASSTEEILAKCPKFRILVLGKSGAGKSSLINGAFNVDLANVSHEQSGVSDIDEEITSDQNSRFILHDSQGFAAGETQNFETVKRFIDGRAVQPELKDRLHAIWFCMEIPTENGALFQTADEKFLKLELYNVPVIVVFTKFDLLVRKLEREATDVDGDALETVVHKRRYRNTLVQLVDETQSRLDERMWILWALAQRASVDGKIDACIEVGRRKYWRGLASSLHFPGKSLKQCLDRIHDDMIDVWNFNDPDKLLKSQDFKIIMADLLKDLDDTDSKKAAATKDILRTVTGTIGAVTSIIPGAVAIAIPAAAGVAIAQWLYFAYQETPAILQLLMGYICDLTNVLQCLFWIMRVHGEGAPVQSQLIETALDAHDETGAPRAIHHKIRSFMKQTSTFEFSQKDKALNELIRIIQSVRFQPENSDSEGRRSSLSMTIATDILPP
ncbi:hypothetical protein D9757_012476 [Collybiopsis confluens]|uniref:G domain-containing protein n=1 Tax=Collybiopsis confluens TaxID=2823264 RepID=A0A8H5G182_9AGAR|nr:hypothetical protein D9757_012476 [Collybiopsis confluens]